MRCRRLVMVGLIASAATIGGCLEMDSVLLIRPDGSGTLTQTLLFSQMASQMMTMPLGPGGAAPEAPAVDPFKKMISSEVLAKRAATMGKDVKVKSARVLTKEDGRRGREVVYSFADANAFKLPMMQDDGKGSGSVMGPGGPPNAAGQPKKEKKEEFATLKFVKATALTPAKLTIIMPKLDEPTKGDGSAATKPSEPKRPAKMDPQQMAMMKMMFAGTRMRLVVRTDGKITRTNATHPLADGKGLALFDLNFGKLVQDDEALSKMEAMQDDMTFEMTKKKLKAPLLKKYMKLEMNPKVEVEFK